MLFQENKQSGFTLIELMVVMAIIAILATAGLSAYTEYIKKARDSARLSIASQIDTAVNALMGSNGGVPPDDSELIAYLDTLNMIAAIDAFESQESSLLAFVPDTISTLIGVPSLSALIREPSGGKSICLGYLSGNVVWWQSCAFRYIVYEDDTYVIWYGVESESNMKKNFYLIQAPTSTTPAPYYMQVTGTAQYVGTPSIWETGAPTKSNTVAYASSKVTVSSGIVTNDDTFSGVNAEKSAPLSAESANEGGGAGETPDACNNSCIEGQECVEGVCTDTAPTLTCGNGLTIGGYATVVADDGKCWLASNLHWYYQWMRKVSGWTSGWTWNTNNPDYGDPCPEGSHTPTSEEWATFLNAEGITNNLTAASSTLNLSGWTNAIHATSGLPYSSGVSYYWSSSRHGSYASTLSYHASLANPATDALLTWSFSVRCLQD